jgi:hypothetical protein
MKTLFTDDYIDIYELDAPSSARVLKLLWKPSSEHLSEKDYKRHIHTWADTVRDMRPHAVLVDTRKHLVSIDLPMQTWFVENIFPKYAQSGMTKLAFIESEDFISQISIEQTMDEDTNVPFKTAYFDTEEKALQWIHA